MMILVKKRILKEFGLKKIKISGGIFIKPKPKKSRLDLIELNCLGPYKKDRITTGLNMLININYQDDNYERVCEYTEFLYLSLVDSPLTNNLKFTAGYQDIEFQIYRLSPYLWVGNCPLSIQHISK